MRRRHLLALGAAGAAGLVGPALAVEPDRGAEAVEFVRRTGVELGQTVSGTHSKEERRAALAPFIERVVDVDGVARFCLGRFWRQATDEQKAEYLRLFRAALVGGVVNRLAEYQAGSTKIEFGKPDTSREDGVLVPTVVSRPDNRPVSVAWLVTTEGGTPRLADVVAEGISLRLTQRNDYASFLARHGNDLGQLLDALRAQVTSNGS